MRINPIQSFDANYLQNKPVSATKKIMHKSSSMDLNLLNNTYNQVSFKASKGALELVKKIPLEDRLASIFENMQLGDLIIVGKKLSDVKKPLYSSAKHIKNVIKRAFYIEDDKLEGSLAFFKNPLGDKEVINLNEKDITLISGDKTYPLKPNDSFYVVDYDILNIEGSLLTIKPKPKTNLSAFRKSFARAFDFQADAGSEIEKLNKRMISQLAKDTKKSTSKVTFKDVGGQDKLIDELKKSVIYPLRYPEGYENIDINRGFILYGPPGTGKTHIARALANEADVNFMSLNGTELESKWVGESEENWRNLFEEAKQKQPTIMFIDEFDSVAKRRSGKDEYGDKVVDQLLTLMTDLDNNNENVFVIGATNNFKALDEAIIRPGRFGKHLEIKLPDLEGTAKIFDIHSSNKPLDEAIDKKSLIQKLYDLKSSGADIRYIINEAHSNGYDRAGIFEKMENKTLVQNDIDNFRITQEDFDKAIKDFVETRSGTQRKTIGFNA